jgi:ABC-2 type transport system permease protein
MLRFLLEKEFRQIFRDPAILRMMFIMPIIQLVLLPLAANYEVKNVLLAVVDHDHSTYSRQLVDKVTASGYFKLVGYNSSYDKAMKLVEKDQADIILEIPAQFEKQLIRESEAPLHMAVNAVNGTKANIGAGYLSTIIRNYNNEIRQRWLQLPRLPDQPQINTTYSNWYNVSMDYKHFMVPGILVVLLTMVGAFLTALNISSSRSGSWAKSHLHWACLLPAWCMALYPKAISGSSTSSAVYTCWPCLAWGCW